MNYLNKKRIALMRNKKFKGYIRRVSGYPLTLTDCMNDNLISCKIYGADGGVGDKTANLFDISKSEGFTSPYGGISSTIDGNTIIVTYTSVSPRSVNLILGTFEPGSYYIGIDADTDRVCNVWDVTNGKKISVANKVITITETLTLKLNTGFTIQGVYRFKNIQITKSDVPTEYEPYGYRIPITVRGENEEQTVNAYAQNPVNADETLDIAEIQPNIPLYKGTNEIAIGTSVPPSGVEITYYADKEG